MRGPRRMSSVGTMSHPQSYELLLIPDHSRTRTGAPGRPLRSAVVSATGETGASGYPRYTGEGMEADIDPETRTVEAVLVDGEELDPGMSVHVADGMRPTG
ncbi:hypothetical protein FHX79_116316 [Streptomyces cavourensis]|nr:hypothetical protein FHX79_116316 [Streptomyces cavourensis]GGU73209.1 hypothetical protein GCM10010498_34220 [Streptomyces cavourensis]SCD60422.1 hypothetical protein GA0115244_106925 [Streptomyces sp. DvalAA-19]